MKRGAFLDRDGVINIDHGYTYRIAEFEFVPGVLAGARALAELGFALVVVTNQSGIGRGLYSEADFHRLTDWMRGEFARAGATLAGVYYCPHHPTDAQGAYLRACDCRKPGPGMLRQAIEELGLQPARSVMFGDRASDLQAAAAVGVKELVLLGTDGRDDPPADEASALATARYRSLEAAMASDALVARLTGAAHV